MEYRRLLNNTMASRNCYIHWCPHGCGKKVVYYRYQFDTNKKEKKKGFYCILCKKYICKTLKQLKAQGL
jgi:hypothetical protein